MDEVEKKDEDIYQGKIPVPPSSEEDTKELFSDKSLQLTGRENSQQVTIKFLRYEKKQLEDRVKQYESKFHELSENNKQLHEELSKKKSDIAAKEEIIKAKNSDLYEKKAFETIQKIMITIGTTSLGFLSMIKDYVTWLVFLILGLLLVISGLFFPSKMMFKNKGE